MHALLIGVLSFFLLPPLITHAEPPALSREELPREVTRAVQVFAQLKESRLESQQDGRTTGFVQFSIQINTQEGFHIYKDQLQFKALSEGPSIDLKVLTAPPAVRFLDPITHSLKEGYQTESVFTLQGDLAAPLSQPPVAGATFPIAVKYQACSSKICLLPVAQRIEIPFTLQNEASPLPKPTESWLARLASRLRLSQEGITPLTLAALFIAGLLTAFTPCVYPLYPITLGTFAHWGANSVASALPLSLAYCGGLTLSYAAVGAAAAATGSLFGGLTQSPFVGMAVGVSLLLSALSFAGWLEFPIPSFIKRSLGTSNNSKHGSWSQAALLGGTLGIVASPCVGPVLVAVLAWIGTLTATHESSTLKAALLGFSLLSVFGMGMSLPFLVMGHMIIRQGRHPRLGRWTPYVKQFGTALMLLASLFYIVPATQRLLTKTNKTIFPFKVHGPDADLKGQWIIVDFRADWCAACVQLEQETFTHKRIVSAITSSTTPWAYQVMDLTEEKEPASSLAKTYGVVSLPSVLLIRPDGQPCKAQSLHEFEDAASFEARLIRARQGEC